MAVRAKKRLKTPHDAQIQIWMWEGLTNGDTGDPLNLPFHADRSVHASAATWGAGGKILIQGSNMREMDTPEYATLTDPQGNSIELNTNKLIEQVMETTYLIRPYVSEGDGTTDLTVYILIRQ